MHDGVAGAWREVLDKHLSAMVDELAGRLDSEVERAVSLAVAAERTQAATESAQAKAQAEAELAEARARAEEETARARAQAEAEIERVRAETREVTRQTTHEATLRSTSETLNQTLRRLRHSAAEGPVLRLVTEASAPWAQRAVVLLLENNQARSIASRGLAQEPEFEGEKHEAEFMFPVSEAEAIASAMESKDPVIALATGPAISPVLARALGGDPDDKTYLFPIVSRQNVTAVLAASGAVIPAPLELLCEAAGMKMEALAPETPAPLVPLQSPELVRIAAPAPAAAENAPRLGWGDLTQDDQKLHLQAQRVARVRVAEMRLDHADELRRGVFSGDIYGALRTEIDKARSEFLQTFLSKSPTMVDYLHLEILRSLAHDDDRLLGHEYPGPMV